ncbi:MAG: TorF family putative porin [Bacteroidota bacterium]
MKCRNFLLSAFILLLTGLTAGLSAQEEEKESPFSAGFDLMSRYVWRGTDFGASPSVQPCLEFSKGGFTVGAWGAYATNLPGTQEADLYVGYTYKELISLTFTDYFFPDELSSNNHYFEYRDTVTGHVFEMSACYEGTEDFPLTFLIASNIYGGDAKKLDDNGNINGIQYSTYAELGYSFKNISVFAGFNVIAPDTDQGESGFYGNEMGFVNIGCTVEKEIKITDDYKLPVTVSLITNPEKEKIYFVAGFSF